MKLVIKHQLSEQQALNKIQNFTQSLKKEYAQDIDELHEDWNGNTGEFAIKAKGLSVKGKIIVSDGEVIIQGHVPLLLKPFQSQIEEMIKSEVEKVLNS